MTPSATRRFVSGGAGIALAAGLLFGFAMSRFGATAVGYGMLGWAPMALVGVAGGAWTVSRHGTPGPGFLVAVGTGMLTRLILAGAGAAVTLLRAEDGLYAYFAGVGAGYLPVQLFEMGWFIKYGRVQS